MKGLPRERATGIRPKLVAQVASAFWTRDDLLRQVSFLGLRADKKASQCRFRDRER